MTPARRSRAVAAALGATAAWLGSCASPAPEPVVLARVSLESYRGLPAPRERVPVLPRRVDILVDATGSMGRPGGDGRARISEAAARASELLLSLPQGTEITLRALGHQQETACVLPERLAGPAIPTLRGAFVRQLEGLAPHSEGSVAAALAQIRSELEREEATGRTRVVVFSDLESYCGGDLCSEARGLVTSGARLEVVALGDKPPPACLAALEAPAAPTAVASPRVAPPPPSFHIHAAGEGGRRDDSTPLAHGRAGDGAVEVPAGLITMVVDLDPPEAIGPFQVEPGGSVLVRLLDYPDARPPTRMWRVERADEPVGRAFPPPEKLEGNSE